MKRKWIVSFFAASLVWGIQLVEANVPSISSVIDRFVAAVHPGASHYFWVVNDSRSPTENEIIFDINTIVTMKAGDNPSENRFLLLIVNGELFAAQNIPLGATVDCGEEEEI